MEYFLNIIVGFMVGLISKFISSDTFVISVFGYLLMIVIAITSSKDFIKKAAIFSFIGMFIGYNLKGNLLNESVLSDNSLVWIRLAVHSGLLIAGISTTRNTYSNGGKVIGIGCIILSVVLFAVQIIMPIITLRWEIW